MCNTRKTLKILSGIPFGSHELLQSYRSRVALPHKQGAFRSLLEAHKWLTTANNYSNPSPSSIHLCYHGGKLSDTRTNKLLKIIATQKELTNWDLKVPTKKYLPSGIRSNDISENGGLFGWLEGRDTTKAPISSPGIKLAVLELREGGR